MTDRSWIKFPIFTQFPNLLCAVSTRLGGVSTGDFATANMGLSSGDNPANAHENRRQYYSSLGIKAEKVVLSGQIHSSNIKRVTTSGFIDQNDAMYTSEKDLYLGIIIADCFPVFLYSPEFETIAAIHAGWRGSVDGIIQNTVNQLQSDMKITPSSLYAAIGPGLQAECFEIREDVFRKFPQKYLEDHPDTTKRYLNLNKYIFDRLSELGIPDEQIENDQICTFCQQERFFSYRRDGIKSGRMLGLIGIRH